MTELLTSPDAWRALPTPSALESVPGIADVVRLPPRAGAGERRGG